MSVKIDLGFDLLRGKRDLVVPCDDSNFVRPAYRHAFVFLGVFLGVFLATHMCAPPRGTHFLHRQGGRRGKEGNRVIVSGGGGEEEEKSEEEEEDGGREDEE